MKHSVAVKFIAIVLCAASLLGAIGGVAGVMVLTQGGLYTKTVEQIWEERLQSRSQNYARNLAMMYAGSAMGGCPEALMAENYDVSWFETAYPNFGYVIMDAEGTVLSSYQPLREDTASVYSVPVSGQYMHLVDVQSVEEFNRETMTQQAIYTDADGIPLEGIGITHVDFLDQYGNMVFEASCESGMYRAAWYQETESSGVSYDTPDDQLGHLFRNAAGQVVFAATLRIVGAEQPLSDMMVHQVSFRNPELNFSLYLENGQEPVGYLSGDADGFVFMSVPVTAAEETLPEETAAEETVPETTAAAETLPAETAAVVETTMPTQPEAEPVMTAPLETVPSMASAVPETAPAEAVMAPVETAPAETLPPETLPPETAPAETLPPETLPEETVPAETEPVLINGKTLDNYQINTYEYYDGGQQMRARYVYVPMPELTVEIYVDASYEDDAQAYVLLGLLRQYRDYLLPLIGGCLLLFAICAVYLCGAAGHRPKCEEIRAGGLNALPLDLYFLVASTGFGVCIAFAMEAPRFFLRESLLVGCAVTAGLAFLACLIFVAFCFALVAQMKTPNGFCWRRSLCGMAVVQLVRFTFWFENYMNTRGFPALGRGCVRLWQLMVKLTLWICRKTKAAWSRLAGWMGRGFRWMGRTVNRFASLLPLTWQWMAGGVVILLSAMLVPLGNPVLSLFGILVALVIVLYAAHCFGVLLESTRRMSKGDLKTKVEDKFLGGCFREFAGDLNDLAGVAVVAAQKQLKSERMKTELITNVSHDIKTPLTSIINYVDLLQKPHTEEEEQQYLEVLERQSLRLKKLIDDLMDMSKASTGNMTVEITQVNAVESVNQALGEFSDKLERAQLIPVFRHEGSSMDMMADGKLVWRVLSNLLGNAVKYAMPGTRLYVDLMQLEGKVILSLKNISREELNVDAEELMERFVRGDDSRNTEGSGLGLNIAKSLMELQKGELQLLVDGDLFKVTLIFPGAV